MPNEALTQQKPKYLIDTCAFVVFEELYPFDSWEAVWNFLLELVDAGVVRTTDDVVEELKRRFYNLKVTDWVKKHEYKIKIVPKKEHYEYLQNEVYPKCDGLINPNITTTLYADPMLVAIAGYENFTLITDEAEIDVQPNTNSFKLKLPNHCKKINAKCISGRYAWPKFFNETGLVVNKFKTVPNVKSINNTFLK